MKNLVDEIRRAYATDYEETVDILRFWQGGMGEYLYLATPYTKYPAGRQQAANDAAVVVAVFAGLGINAISPIVHWHEVEKFGAFGDDPFFWAKVNEPLLNRSKALLVTDMPGWEESTGMKTEVEHAKRWRLKRIAVEIPMYMLGLTPTSKDF